MAKIYGVCKNIDGECPKALSKEKQAIERSAKFECEECHKPLIEIPNTSPPQQPPWGKILIAVAALAVVGFVVYWFALRPASPVPTIAIEPATVTVVVKGVDSLTLKVEPEDAAKNMKWVWTSSDKNIATVSKKGVVTGVKEGTATITVTAEKDTSILATALVTVKDEDKGDNVKPEPEQVTPEPAENIKDPQPTDPNRTGTVKVPGGEYKGELKNGKPHGLGTITYSSRTLILPTDMKKRYAEAGEYVTGQFKNGEIVSVKWYDKSGTYKDTIM